MADATSKNDVEGQSAENKTPKKPRNRKPRNKVNKNKDGDHSNENQPGQSTQPKNGTPSRKKQNTPPDKRHPNNSAAPKNSHHGKNQHRAPRQNQNEDNRSQHNRASGGIQPIFKIHKNTKPKLPKCNFQEYISEKDCSDGLKRGELIQGAVRINQKNFAEAYINSGVYGERDIFLDGVAARNRALPGDVVAVSVLPKEEWKGYGGPGSIPGQKNERGETIQANENCMVKRGRVVFIVEQKNSRVATGYINQYRRNQFGFALMSPIDNRLPRLMIPLYECPPTFKDRPADFGKTLFVAQIKDWEVDLGFAYGALMRSLGEAGHIGPETEAIIAVNGIDSSLFSPAVLSCLPNASNWCITEEELAKRTDLRSECIFTIDPATARDLDDALSCKPIGDDLYEVGVHIADVSHFIEQGSALDEEAASRATSVYLSQKVIPMLPSVLCEQLCSLNPNVERLAYSVKWHMKSDGTVLNEWFGKSVIRSCIKMSYSHAQQMIEMDDKSEINPDQFPELGGGFSLAKIREKCQMLYKISQNLRNRRFESGALRLDQPKLCFNLDSETGLPNGYSVYEYKDSNRMIEEFMLMANMAVGRKILTVHPDQAILRSHPPPQAKMIEEVRDTCVQHDIPFDISSSKAISNSLTNIANLGEEKCAFLYPALVMLCTKPFQNAVYFCTGTVDDEEQYQHYALNVPIYTHFTSPIRRYPDVLVHRLLTAALRSDFEVRGTPKQLQATAVHCNDKKTAAKSASQQSSDLFFAVYVKECGPLEERGVVMTVFDKALDVLCVCLGVVKRVYYDKLCLAKHTYDNDDPTKPKVTLFWKQPGDDKAPPAGETVEERVEALREKLEAKWVLKKEASMDEAQQLADTIKQELAMFTGVQILLSVDAKTPTKINVVLKNPFVSDAPTLNL